ncbi:MAG: CHAT domain-containing protein [Cyclobacteriaceae bacterium]|nr:CHAT domain-containing protein [Cyclobacteriaceae bacterium]
MRQYILAAFLLLSIQAFAQKNKLQRNIMSLYRSKSFSKTEQILVSALNESKQKGFTDHTIYYQLMLGENYQRQGLLPEAEQMFTEALDETKKILPLTSKNYYLGSIQSQRTYFDVYDRLGFFYISIGNLNKAEQLFRESKALRDNYFNKTSVHKAMSLAGLGSVEFTRKNYEQAYQYHTQALIILKSASTTGYNYDYVYRIIYNDLTEIGLITNRTEEVDLYSVMLAKTSAGREQYGTKVAQQAETARIFDVFARNELLKGNYKKAQLYLNRAQDFLPIVESTGTVGFKLRLTQARLHWLNNNLPEAASSFKKLIESYQKYVVSNFIKLSEYEREKFYYTLKHDIEIFNAFLLMCHKQGIAEQYGLYEVAYNNQLNMKALLLGNTNERKSKILSSNDAQLISLFDEWERARTQLSASYYLKNAENDVLDLTRKVETMDKELALKIPTSQITDFDWRQVNAKLSDFEYAVEIVRVEALDPAKPEVSTNEVSYMMLVNKHGADLKCFVIDNAKELETRSARFYRNAILSRSEDNLSYDKLWLPFHSHLNEPKRVYLSPDGVFSQINLNTIFNPTTKKFLIDELELVYLTNTSDLLIDRNTKASKTAALFGRPSYSATISDAQTTNFRSLQNEDLVSLKDQTFSDLPGTQQEIEVAEQVLKNSNWNVQRFQAELATEKNLKAVNSPSLLHIATHGFFIGDSTRTINPMIRSGLLLAGVSSKLDDGQDGILTAYEASLLNLRETQLVVLSACETGLGEIRNGEGVYGLQRAMIAAGTKNLLMSLWKVDDAATSELMNSFYRVWANQSETVKSFRQAQLEVRKKYPHPFYWGAFIMLGN